MKKRSLVALLTAVFLSLTACLPRQGTTSVSEPEPVSSVPEKKETSVNPEPELPEDSSSPEISLSQQTGETAVFSLRDQEIEEKTMSVGETIGNWTLTDLQITYFEESENISSLTAEFSGEAPLKGTITRSNLLDEGYDFGIDEGDVGKIPQYISPDVNKDVEMFLLNIPEDFADFPKLEHGDSLNCQITVSSYKFQFAYHMAPSSATLVRIDELE